jgi:hypothetical protein
MAGIIFSQLELKTLVIDRRQQIYPILPATPTARRLRGLVRHRYELIQELTRRKNKLVAITHELFPELSEVYRDIHSPSALALLTAFPTPQAIAEASLDELCETRLWSRPGRTDLARLQELAESTIGTKDKDRRDSLVLEQSMLIDEIRLFQSHVARLEGEIARLVEQSREGQILTSFTGIGPMSAAILLSGIGTIANFERASRLRGYLGWAPRGSQTGTSYDSSVLNKSGNGLLKQSVYLITLSAIKNDPSWRALYDRLVLRMCPLDQRTGKRRGKMKAVGRVAGQIINVLFHLLKHDYELVRAHTGNGELPEPELYDVNRHLAELHITLHLTPPSEQRYS